MAPDRSNNEKRVRVIESDTDYEEMQAGHIIPGADPPKNEHARGGFGDRDGRNGFGTDSSDGVTSLSMNEDTESSHTHTDGLQTMNQLSSQTTTAKVVDPDDDLTDDDDDLDDTDIDDTDDDFDDADLDDDLDLDDDDLDLDDDLDEDLDEDDDDNL